MLGIEGRDLHWEAIEYWQYNAGTTNFASLYNNTYAFWQISIPFGISWKTLHC